MILLLFFYNLWNNKISFGCVKKGQYQFDTDPSKDM